MTDRPPGAAEFAPPTAGPSAPTLMPNGAPNSTPLAVPDLISPTLLSPGLTWGERSTGRRAGQLAATWQIVVAATWALVFFAFAATWKASEEIGIGTWWLGPRADPQSIPVRMIPFALALFVALCAVYNIVRVAWISIVGALAVAGIAVFDIPRSGGLAAIEFAIAAAALLVSLGALTGTYRMTRPSAPSAPSAPTAPPADGAGRSPLGASLPPPQP